MTEVDYYEIVRQKLVLGPLVTPKHRKIIKLMKIFWNEEEIKLLSHFDPADQWTSLKQLVERSGLSKDEIKKILRRPFITGTISKKGAKYCLEPILPGIFERYFQRNRDTEENFKKAAPLFRALMKEVAPQGDLLKDKNWRLFRPLLPLEAEEKLIEINKDFDVQSQTLPYESIKNLIDKHDMFAVITCQCRHIAELTGEPCEIAPAEMGCFIAGPGAQMMVDGGILGARYLNKEEAIEFIKETEKRGLVHNTVYDEGNESSMFVCNCCGCHCGVLYPPKLFNERGAYQSNYSPKFNNELCTKCETCMRKCPQEAIYHKFPIEPDLSDEQMVLREELCIGCGICSVNCPNDALKMVKVRDNIPPKKNLIGNKTFLEMLQ
ncbi:MAG: 4Fe-4S binding protein [Candidatus Lokiarchaeota archaeon]|nr:4Fe-4S binding protein [Candidatus Lokiarchaeota archaeon]